MLHWNKSNLPRDRFVRVLLKRWANPDIGRPRDRLRRRLRWGVENGLHSRLALAFGEDQRRTLEEHAA